MLIFAFLILVLSTVVCYACLVQSGKEDTYEEWQHQKKLQQQDVQKTEVTHDEKNLRPRSK
jgi:heat shock protein HslJ